MVLCDGAGCEDGPGSATEDVPGHAHCLGPHVSLFSLLPISFISRAEIPPFPSPWFPAQNTIQSLCTKPGASQEARPRGVLALCSGCSAALRFVSAPWEPLAPGGSASPPPQSGCEQGPGRQ